MRKSDAGEIPYLQPARAQQVPGGHPVGRHRVGGGLLKCVRCVKKECVYRVYDRGPHPRQMVDSLDSICMDCFRCVQNCPNRLIEKGLQSPP